MTSSSFGERLRAQIPEIRNPEPLEKENLDVQDHLSVQNQRPSQESYVSTFPEYKKPHFNYDALAELIAEEPSLSIFRRFAKLNAKNLLYLQAELAELELQLKRKEDEDRMHDCPNTRQFQWHVRRMVDSKGEQWEMVQLIRTKLREYNDALLQFKKLNTLRSPSKYNQESLQEYIESPCYGGCWLEPPEHVWDNEVQMRQNHDLVDLCAYSRDDPFSRWLTWNFMPWLHKHLLFRFKHGKDSSDPPRTSPPSNKAATPSVDPESLSPEAISDPIETDLPSYHYSDRALARIAETFSIVVSSLLPTASIFALNYIPPAVIAYRLAFITVFSVLFTVCLAIFTEARRIEIFAAVAALASVQVVFIGTSGNSGGAW